ncbi:hypothetical protein DIURU_004419 [Diutina rugosa]|uniref:Uncharacterized protein n=1 Tax=Diutina rugosa TaxID=5481 RepID=A0A642UJV2_DIURU|nr:uncharacterized protein DIURU_004419 [Diutina rugosa]KAA8899237.1 hypothetical protein DIURU_004419 [Diutina rugosa]
MAEQFGRANSTRWNAEVPDYDDWGHEYDDEVQQLADVAEDLAEDHDETASEPEPEENQPHSKQAHHDNPPPLNPLVLSIDQPSDDDDSDIDDTPTNHPSPPQTKQTRPPAPPTISISGPEEAPPSKPVPPPPPPMPKAEVVQPPTTPPSKPVVPKVQPVPVVPAGEEADEEDSYDSDDSIQVEHTLNVASPNKRKSLLIDPNKVNEEFLNDPPDSPTQKRKSTRKKPASAAPMAPPPIPMFVINHDYDKDLPTDDSWGTPRETPPAEDTKHPVPIAEEPVPEEPNEPAYDEPAYKEPAYEEPAYEKQTYEEPTYEEPAYKEPAYTEPVYEEPAYTEPVTKQVDIPAPPPPVVAEEPVNRKSTKRKAPIGPKPLEPEITSYDHHQEPEASTASNAATPAPLVLSIDNEVSDSSDDNWGHQTEDEWGHNSDSSSEGEIDEPTPYRARSDTDSDNDPTPDLNITKSSSNHTTMASPRQPVDTTMLDDLMHDIENVSYGEPDVATPTVATPQQEEPPRKPSGAKELPEIDTGDFSSSFARYMDQEWSENPITPLSPAQSISMHQDFVRSVSDRRSSVRKPPSNPRAALVSMDYSSIADAVSNYMDDDSKTIDSVKRSERVRDDISMAEEASVMSSEASFTKNDDRNGIPPPPPPKIDIDMSSRRSSAQTLGGFGQWKPNTSTFRDQFINEQADSDTESNTIIESNYSKFTQPRSRVVSEVPSLPETIDVAMPRIDEDEDANLSSDDSRRISMDTVGSSVLVPPTSSKPVFHEEKLTPNPSMEEVHDKDAKPVKQRYSSLLDGIEDKPKVPEKQRYSSLLAGVSGGDGRDRSVSNATDKSVDTIVATPPSNDPLSTLQESEPTADTSIEDEDDDKDETNDDSGNNLTQSVSKPSSLASLSQPQQQEPATSVDPATVKFTPKRYPVSDWKQIMSTGQPVDKIANLKSAIEAECNYDTGLHMWLEVVVKQQKQEPQMTNGRIATEAYQNATHSDIRRHNSLNTKQIVGDVKDSLVNAAPAARSFGKKFFNKSKSLMKKAN